MIPHDSTTVKVLRTIIATSSAHDYESVPGHLNTRWTLCKKQRSRCSQMEKGEQDIFCVVVSSGEYCDLLKLHCLSPRANYTDRVTATCRRSVCQLLRIVGATWSA
jgi:3-dehydroquinate dehydratase